MERHLVICLGCWEPQEVEMVSGSLPLTLRVSCLAGALIALLGAGPAGRAGGLEGLALLSPRHVEKMEELNRELGKLCSKPPPQALSVCRLHARLVNPR